MSVPSSRRRLMDEADAALSMKMSPRAAQAEDNEGLRTLIVHRLSDTTKAVARLSLRGGRVSVLCEPCGKWCRQDDDDVPLEWRCPHCNRFYEIEFAILEEVND